MTTISTRTNTIDTTAERHIEIGRQAKALWREWIRQGGRPNATQMAIYAILRNKDMAKTFSPIINRTKLANGQGKWDGRDLALNRAMLIRGSDWNVFSPMLGEVQSKPVRWMEGEVEYIPQDNEILTMAMERARLAREEQ